MRARVLDRLGEEVALSPARGQVVAIGHPLAVDDRVDGDTFGLRGDPDLEHLPPAPGGEGHLEGRAARRGRRDRPEPRGDPPAPGPELAGVAAPRLTARRERFDDGHAQAGRQPRKVVDRLDDVRRPWRSVVGGIAHRHRADPAEERPQPGQVERRGDRLPPARLADEREVRDVEVETARERRQHRQPVQAVTRPARAIDEQPVGHVEQLARPARLEPRLVGPPHRDGQVVDEQRRDEPGQVLAGLAAAGQVDELGAGLGRFVARQDAVSLDLGVDPGRAVRVGRGHDDRP